MQILSIKENPSIKEKATDYIISIWANNINEMVYRDCIDSMMVSSTSIPQWAVLMDHDQIVGCIGLVMNDFISRMDLWPWIVAVYVAPSHRKSGNAFKLLEWACQQAKDGGFKSVYLATDLDGFYEKAGFEYLAMGYHPWGETSKIYHKQC